MAINNLRQQNIFDQYGLNLNMPNLYSSSGNSGYEEPDYSNDYQQGPRNIYDSYEGPDYGPVDQPDYTPPPPPESIFEQLRGQYHPETEATEKFNQLIAGQPEREKVGWGRRLVAMAAGIGSGGLGTASKIMDEPYERSQAKWKSQIEPAYQAAQLEGGRNANERQLMSQMVLAKRNEDQNRTNQEKIASNERVKADEIASREKIANDKIQLGWAVQNGATAHFEGETVILTYKDGRPPVNTGVPTTRFSPVEIANINAASREKVANIQGTTARDVANTRAGAAVEAAGIRGAGAGGTKPSALEGERQRQVRMREVYENQYNDPAVQKYLKPNNGKFMLAPRPVAKEDSQPWNPFSSGVSQKEVDAWDRVKAAIDPGYTPPRKSVMFDTPPSSAPAVGKPPLPPGKVRIRTSDGREGFYPANTPPEQMKSKGYTVIEGKLSPNTGRPNQYQD